MNAEYIAHKLDEENNGTNGQPVLHAAGHYRKWADVLSGEYRAFADEVRYRMGELDLVGANITWHIPVAFLASAWVFAMILWQVDPNVYPHPTYHVLSGWMMLVSSSIHRSGFARCSGGISWAARQVG